MDSLELKEKEIFKAWEFRGAKLSFSDFELKFFLWQNKPMKSNIAACACPFPRQMSLKYNCIPLLLKQKQEQWSFTQPQALPSFPSHPYHFIEWRLEMIWKRNIVIL
jgi:hypothetical protein